MKLWHGDSHLIADDGISKGEWKNDCHRINGVIDTIASMFKMVVKSSRIANAQIAYLGVGDIADTGQKGWLSRALASISPL